MILCLAGKIELMLFNIFSDVYTFMRFAPKELLNIFGNVIVLRGQTVKGSLKKVTSFVNYLKNTVKNYLKNYSIHVTIL